MSAIKLLEEARRMLVEGDSGYHTGSPDDMQWRSDRNELTTRIDALLKSGGWISVEDRLPDDEELVIVYTPAKNGEESNVGFDAREEGGWVNHDASYEHYCAVAPRGGYDAESDVRYIGPSECAPYTHWHPLPPLPQKEGES